MALQSNTERTGPTRTARPVTKCRVLE